MVMGEPLLDMMLREVGITYDPNVVHPVQIMSEPHVDVDEAGSATDVVVVTVTFVLAQVIPHPRQEPVRRRHAQEAAPSQSST